MNFIEKIKHYSLNKKKNNFTLTLFSKILVFLVFFFAAFLVLYFLLIYFNGYSFVSTFFAKTVYTHFSYSPDIVLSGTTLDFQSFEINITDVCSGAYELILFLSLIFACFEIKLWKRLAGILSFLIIFIIFNFIRIISIIYALAYFDTFSVSLLHTVFFKVGFFVFTLLFFAYFLIVSN
jgi:exosortase/archaeosortase family protein